MGRHTHSGRQRGARVDWQQQTVHTLCIRPAVVLLPHFKTPCQTHPQISLHPALFLTQQGSLKPFVPFIKSPSLIYPEYHPPSSSKYTTFTGDGALQDRTRLDEPIRWKLRDEVTCWLTAKQASLLTGVDPLLILEISVSIAYYMACTGSLSGATTILLPTGTMRSLYS